MIKQEGAVRMGPTEMEVTFTVTLPIPKCVDDAPKGKIGEEAEKALRGQFQRYLAFVRPTMLAAERARRRSKRAGHRTYSDGLF